MGLFRWRPLSIVLVVLLWTPECSADELAAQGADRDMFVARYYLSRHDYSAAIGRLKTLVTRYPASPLMEEAFVRLAESYVGLLSEIPVGETRLRQGIASEAQTAVALLDRKFPTSYLSLEGNDALKSAALDPVEDENSWISKVSR